MNMVLDRQIGIDRDSNAIRGVILAEVGEFKTPDRGQFDLQSLEEIRELINSSKVGLKARYKHPNTSDDGTGKFLGRYRDAWLDDGKLRADLYFSKTARKPTPQSGGVAYQSYIMELVGDDVDALNTSFAPNPRYLEKIDQGDQPPIWRIGKLVASDIVDDGDATHGGFLSSGTSYRNSSEFASVATQYMDQLFSDLSADEIRVKAESFVSTYLQSKGLEMKTEETQLTQEQLSTAIGEALSPIVSKYDQLEARLDELVKQQTKLVDETKRRDEITELCTLAGFTDSIADFVDNDELSVDDVRRELFKKMKEDKKLTAQKGEVDKGGEPKEVKLLRDEYLEAKEVYEPTYGNVDEYIKEQMLERFSIEWSPSDN